MDEKFLKPYNPQDTEERIYKMWEESGLFSPEKSTEAGLTPPDAKPFTIIMPPPNVTGVLHMGHALMLTLEDIMIRYKRMRDFRALWLPGTDHAAIATQSVVEKNIYKKEGRSRHDLGREGFVRRVEEFATQSHDTIVSQIKKMGASCDWSREAYTLDEPRSLAVRTMFKMMYDDGLIYRKNRIVNWDPKGQTTISDDEIVYEERPAKLYTFKYSKDFPIAISTTRPETKLGDMAVAVHPDDKRYKEFIGKEYDINFAGAKLHIQIVGDESADPEFGTGAVGVTPAHSQTDWEIAERHKLPIVQIIDERAKMMVGMEGVLGKKTSEAREAVVEWLKENNLLIGEEEIKHNIALAERTGGIVEPLPKLQWFVNVTKPTRDGKSLKQLMREAVEKGEVKFVPDYFEKTYYNWVDNLRDWCISRQIWYGHRIPVWYKGEKIFVGTEKPEGEDWVQDEDTLDTWFSSGMWTFSTLGWPNQTEDLKIYHPTDVLETGYEIIFFWVARMIMMSKYALGVSPFRTVYFHGTVRDGQGRKMSKSLGNGIDPLDVAREFGADAGRMALIVGTGPGTDSKISLEKIRGYKHFSNKIWNISRFVFSCSTGIEPKTDDLSLSGHEDDETLKLASLIKDVTEDMEKFCYHLASEKIYHYIWHEFADRIIEEAKPKISEDETKILLLRLWGNCLIILHPFMPFVTEEIWQSSPFKKDSFLMTEKWPKI